MIQMKKVLTRYLGDKDNRTLLLNVAGNYLVKGGAMLVSLLMMPAYMRYFESQAVLGMWFTLIQLLNWIMLLDFGIGGGLRNKIVEPLQKGDKERVIELVSAAYFSVAGIVLVLIALQQIVVGRLNWYKILGLSSGDISEDTLVTMIHILVIGVCSLRRKIRRPEGDVVCSWARRLSMYCSVWATFRCWRMMWWIILIIPSRRSSTYWKLRVCWPVPYTVISFP